MLRDIKKCVDASADKIKGFRRDLHMNPELSGSEVGTAAYISGVLGGYGIEHTSGVGGHGIVGIIRSNAGDGGPVIALRADMDALPITENGGKEYTSCVDGVMHACGHDAHMAVLLGAAGALSSIKDKLHGTVKLFFQPSEEKRESGARLMIADGALTDPRPEAIVALHCYPELASGMVAHCPGVMTASADGIRIVIKGKSGHASRPHQTVDAVLVSSMVINAIHHIVSRRTDPLHHAVISIGTINGGTAENIIADRVEMRGTVRTLDGELRKAMPSVIEETVKGVTQGFGADYEFSYDYELASVDNDPEVDALLAASASDIIGPDNVVVMGNPQMGAEDFAYFLDEIPGTLFRLGTSNAKKGINASLHNPDFDIDEDALMIGAKIMAWTAANFLSRKSKGSKGSKGSDG